MFPFFSVFFAHGPKLYLKNNIADVIRLRNEIGVTCRPKKETKHSKRRQKRLSHKSIRRKVGVLVMLALCPLAISHILRHTHRTRCTWNRRLFPVSSTCIFRRVGAMKGHLATSVSDLSTGMKTYCARCSCCSTKPRIDVTVAQVISM